jgi:hypothetical protein
MNEKEMEEYTDEMRNSGIDTGSYSWSELVEIATAMKNYHKGKLKLLDLHNVSNSATQVKSSGDFRDDDNRESQAEYFGRK